MCAKQVAECLVPFLGLVWLLGDNSDVTCVSIGKSTRNIYVRRYNTISMFSVSQGSVEALIR